MEKSKLILVYDISGLPRNKTIRQVYDDFIEAGVVTWASKSNSNYSCRDIDSSPFVIDRETLEKADGIKFVDVFEE